MKMNLKQQAEEVAEVIDHRTVMYMRWLRLLPQQEEEPSQRARYFSDFERALKFDAIEAGVLPLVRALYELGGQTKFSCHGHLLGKSIHFPYALCWLNPELAQSLPAQIEKVLLAPLHYHWYVETKDSTTSKLAARESGKPGLFLTIHWDTRPHRLMPASGKYMPGLIREWVDADLAEIAQRLNALDLPRRQKAEVEECSPVIRAVLSVLLTVPVVTLILACDLAYSVALAISWLCQTAKNLFRSTLHPTGSTQRKRRCH
jgi:hypothetical protein